MRLKDSDISIEGGGEGTQTGNVKTKKVQHADGTYILCRSLGLISSSLFAFIPNVNKCSTAGGAVP